MFCNSSQQAFGVREKRYIEKVPKCLFLFFMNRHETRIIYLWAIFSGKRNVVHFRVEVL